MKIVCVHKMIDRALADISEFELTVGSSSALPEQISKSQLQTWYKMRSRGVAETQQRFRFYERHTVVGELNSPYISLNGCCFRLMGEFEIIVVDSHAFSFN